MQPSGHPPVIPLQCILVFLGEGGRSQSYAWGIRIPGAVLGGGGLPLPLLEGLGFQPVVLGARRMQPTSHHPSSGLLNSGAQKTPTTQECQDPSLLSSGKNVMEKNTQPRSWELCVIQQTKPRT